jgi:hypothetical protein
LSSRPRPGPRSSRRPFASGWGDEVIPSARFPRCGGSRRAFPSELLQSPAGRKRRSGRPRR